MKKTVKKCPKHHCRMEYLLGWFCPKCEKEKLEKAKKEVL